VKKEPTNRQADWPLVCLLLLSFLSLIPPFTWIGLPACTIAALTILDLWNRRKDPQVKSETTLQQLDNQQKFRVYLTAMIPGSIVAGIAVFGGSCTTVFWGVQVSSPMAFGGGDVYGPLFVGLYSGVFVGAVCGIAGMVYLIRRSLSQRPDVKVDEEDKYS
jgi:hypothetical protein